MSLSGRIAGLAPIRYTPAGLAALEFKVQHLSEQLEAGGRRRVECVVPAVALGPLVERIVAAGDEAPAVFTGFLASRRAGAEQMIFHVTELELERK